jgi:hypothetical protein
MAEELWRLASCFADQPSEIYRNAFGATIASFLVDRSIIK